MTTRIIEFVLLGYLSGSILFARIAARLFHKEDMIENSSDGNPGAANAFTGGGFLCGLFTLVGDLLKGCLPVFVFVRYGGGLPSAPAMALVLAAPVLGHAFPLYHHFRGGKGIAVSFGCLLGLLPMWQPAAILAACFIFFSVILQISPHFYRTMVTYPCALLCMIFLVRLTGVTLGFFLITGIVCLRLHLSDEKREPMKVRILWKH